LEFLASLRASATGHLAGIVWFRLPTDKDVRIWSLETLLAVMSQRPADARIEAVSKAGSVPGMQDVALVNSGGMDIPLPASVVLPPECGLADGINGYSLSRRDKTIFLDRLQMGLLRAHHRLIVGWMRCTGEPSQIHVLP
jgi:hypothetical protein